VLAAEGRVTFVDAILAAAVLAGLILMPFGWWQADPAVGYVLVLYAVREVREQVEAIINSTALNVSSVRGLSVAHLISEKLRLNGKAVVSCWPYFSNP
jgi:hypothetical protein